MRDELIALAKEVGFCVAYAAYPYTVKPVASAEQLERFANLVAAKEREKVARWKIGSGYATGHGDTIEDMLTELEWQIREKEREACAKVCDKYDNGRYANFAEICADEIRARKP